MKKMIAVLFVAASCFAYDLPQTVSVQKAGTTNFVEVSEVEIVSLVALLSKPDAPRFVVNFKLLTADGQFSGVKSVIFSLQEAQQIMPDVGAILGASRTAISNNIPAIMMKLSGAE